MILLVDPFKGRPPDERPIWRLVNGDRRAQALAREVTGVGLELVVTVDGEPRWAEIYRGGIALGVAAAEKRQALLDRGWTDAPAS